MYANVVGRGTGGASARPGPGSACCPALWMATPSGWRLSQGTADRQWPASLRSVRDKEVRPEG
jgi:hypothetical protein